MQYNAMISCNWSNDECWNANWSIKQQTTTTTRRRGDGGRADEEEGGKKKGRRAIILIYIYVIDLILSLCGLFLSSRSVEI